MRTVARALLVVALLLVPRVAMAHLGLSRSVPADGATLATAPGVLRLEFTEAVDKAVARLRLLGPDGSTIRLSALRQPNDSTQIVMADVLDSLGPGAYYLEWRVVGSDGHPVSGTVRFSVTGATVASEAANALDSAAARVPVPVPVPVLTPSVEPQTPHHVETTMPTSSGFDSSSVGYVVVRWLNLTALVVLLGVVVFRELVLRRALRLGEDRETLTAMHARAVTLGRWAASAFVATVVLRLGAQWAALSAGTGGLDSGLLIAMLAGTTWGYAWLLQFALAILVAVGFAAVRKGRAAQWPAVALGVLLLAFAPALSGHAIATPERTAVAVLMDTLHVIGAGGWMGSLLLVLVAGLPIGLGRAASDDLAATRRLIEAFSPTALAFATLIGITGVYAAWSHIGLSAALWQSDYGRVLLLKLAVLSLAVGIGAYNWRVLQPRLASAAAGSGAGGALRTSVVAELGVGVLVLLVTAILVATPPPMEMNMEGGAARGVSQPAAGRTVRDDQWIATMRHPAAVRASTTSSAPFERTFSPRTSRSVTLVEEAQPMSPRTVTRMGPRVGLVLRA